MENISDDELLELHWQGELTLTQIGMKYGYSESSACQKVSQEFKERDLTRRNRSEAHYLAHRLHPEVYNPARGEKHGRWNGGKTKHEAGYIKVRMPEHPNAHKSGYVFEHRIVLEKKLGRLLKPSEIAHHLNGIKDDNRPENLIALTNKTHDKSTFIKVLQARIRELEQLHLL